MTTFCEITCFFENYGQEVGGPISPAHTVVAPMKCTRKHLTMLPICPKSDFPSEISELSQGRQPGPRGGKGDPLTLVSRAVIQWVTSVFSQSWRACRRGNELTSCQCLYYTIYILLAVCFHVRYAVQNDLKFRSFLWQIGRDNYCGCFSRRRHHIITAGTVFFILSSYYTFPPNFATGFFRYRLETFNITCWMVSVALQHFLKSDLRSKNRTLGNFSLIYPSL